MAFLPQPYEPSGESMLKGMSFTLPSGAYDSSLDGANFDTYPEDCGWRPRPAKQWLALFEEQNTDFDKFLQTWLVSGLLSFMFQERVDLAKMNTVSHETIAQDQPLVEPIMTRTWLGPLIEKLRKLSATHEEIRLRRRCWWKVKRASDRLDRYNHDGLTPEVDEDDDFQYSLEGFGKAFASDDPRWVWDNMLLRILLAFFESVLWDRRDEQSTSKDGPEQAFSYVQKLKPVATNTCSFVTLGSKFKVCPATAFRLYARLEAPALLFYLRCRGALTEGGGHEGCTVQHCKELSVNIGCYNRRHFLEACKASCKELRAPQMILLDILCQDRLPLVDLGMENEECGPAFISSPCEEVVPYVAISHVWSDGLGHDSDNALFKCQFTYISTKVRELSDKGVSVGAFWIDTLCVPRKDPASPTTDQYTEAKRKAITLIRTSFLQAVAVLVMDASLMSTSLDCLSDAEILIRILNSPWNARLWTLQEGATAQKLFFQFADGVYDLDDGMTRLRALDDIFLAHTLKPSIERLYTQLRGFYQMGCCATHNLGKVTTAVQLRASTLAADEPLCLAALLKLDLSRIASVKEEERIIEFWQMQNYITFDLYCLKARRIQLPGFRWAPQSLLLHHDKTPNFPPVPEVQELLHRSKHFGTINHHGFQTALLNGELHAHMTIFDLGIHQGQPLEQVMLRIETQLIGHPYMTSTQIRPGVTENPYIDVQQHYGTSQVVLILVADERQAGFEFGTYEEHFEGVGRDGFLAAVRNDVDNTFIHCGEIKHRAELPCETCDAKAKADQEQLSNVDVLSVNEDESDPATHWEKTNHESCGEKRKHEHWKETIYICPARVTLMHDVETPERQRLQQFRHDLNECLRAPDPGQAPLDVPDRVAFGAWQKRIWRVT